MKKIFVLFSSILLILLSLWNVNAFDKESQTKAESFIQEESSDKDSTWYKNDPKITKETPFYSDDDKKASYLEYKISCKNTRDCGFIIVNLDKTDTEIPFASFWWKTLSEQMWSSKKDKNYYFWIFDQFSINNNWDLKTTSPENKVLNNKVSIYSKNWEKNPLYEKFIKLKKLEKKNKKKNIEIQRKNKLESKKYKSRSSKVVIPWSNFTGGSCNSPTPCYRQWRRAYHTWSGIKWWYTGCTPTAFSIVYWYYNKNGYNKVFPNVSSNSTPSSTTRYIKSVQFVVWDLMWTYWNNWQWSTNTWNNPKWWKFLNWKYSYSSDYEWDHWWNNFLETIKREINHSRPIIIGVDMKYYSEKSGHTIVWHWYKWKKVYTNFGWWANSANSIINTNWKDFTTNVSWVSDARMDRLDFMTINN